MKPGAGCDGSCSAGDFGAGALVGAVLVGILWLGLDTWAEVLAGLL